MSCTRNAVHDRNGGLPGFAFGGCAFPDVPDKEQAPTEDAAMAQLRKEIAALQQANAALLRANATLALNSDELIKQLEGENSDVKRSNERFRKDNVSLRKEIDRLCAEMLKMQEAAATHEPCPDDDHDDLPPLEDNDSDNDCRDDYDYALALSLQEGDGGENEIPQMPPQVSQGWSCPQCTFTNNASVSRCEMCKTPAPARKPQEGGGIRERLLIAALNLRPSDYDE